MAHAGVVSDQGARLTAAALGIEGPNMRRSAQAGAEYRVETMSRAEVRTSPGEAPRLERAIEKRIRMTDGVFDRLRARHELARDDVDLSRIYGAAGQRYVELHFRAGYQALKAFDPTKGFSTARPEMSDAAAERKCDALKAFQSADDHLAGAMGLHALPRAIVVRQVLLDDRKLADVGRQLSGGTDAKVCSGIALHELRQGLRALAIHFGLLAEPVTA